jgi:hypothetical protein
MRRDFNYSDIISVVNTSHEPLVPATVGPGGAIVLADKDILSGDIWRNLLPTTVRKIAQAGTGSGRCYSHEREIAG